MRITSNVFDYAAGVPFLAMAAIKGRLAGYGTPSSLEVDDVAGHVLHALGNFSRWIDGLKSLGYSEDFIVGAEVLELGPGHYLGTGALMLAAGAKSYTAYDAFRLVHQNPQSYRLLLASLPPRFPTRRSPAEVYEAMISLKRPTVEYIVDEDFSFDPLLRTDKYFDLIVSNAAFEHFEDCEDVIECLSHATNPKAAFVAWVDFKTHSRWIRSRDPNNIYRYGEGLYRTFRFRGQPNRLRPRDYIRLLDGHRWLDAKVGLSVRAGRDYMNRVAPYLHSTYRTRDAEMDILSCNIVARRP
jgi:hypothetical protein